MQQEIVISQTPHCSFPWTQMQTERQTLANVSGSHASRCLRIGPGSAEVREGSLTLSSCHHKTLFQSLLWLREKVLFILLGLTLHLHRCHLVTHRLIMAIMEMLQAVKQDSSDEGWNRGQDPWLISSSQRIEDIFWPQYALRLISGHLRKYVEQDL